MISRADVTGDGEHIRVHRSPAASDHSTGLCIVSWRIPKSSIPRFQEHYFFHLASGPRRFKPVSDSVGSGERATGKLKPQLAHTSAKTCAATAGRWAAFRPVVKKLRSQKKEEATGGAANTAGCVDARQKPSRR